METLGEFIWLTLWVFLLFAFLMVLFYIFSDLFRDDSLNGWVKGVWIVFLIFFTPITALVYLIARGKGMQERTIEHANAMRKAQHEYIRDVAGSSGAGSDPAEQISKAKALHEQGIIDDAEFAQLKAKALAS